MLCVTVRFAAGVQLSVAVTLDLTSGMAAAQLSPALTAIGAVGQVTDGAVPSRTVIVNEQFDVLPAASVAVQSTDEVPTGSVSPEGGRHMTVTPGQLSVAVART
jgi:hypothetical protein